MFLRYEIRTFRVVVQEFTDESSQHVAVEFLRLLFVLVFIFLLLVEENLCWTSTMNVPRPQCRQIKLGDHNLLSFGYIVEYCHSMEPGYE